MYIEKMMILENGSETSGIVGLMKFTHQLLKNLTMKRRKS